LSSQVKNIIQNALKEGRTALMEHESRDIIQAYGIEIGK